MPQFDISTLYSQIFWLVIVFSILYLIVSKLVSPSTERIFKNRKMVIDSAVEEAESLTLKTEILKKEFETQFKNIQNMAEGIKNESARELDKFFIDMKHVLLQELALKRQESTGELEGKLETFSLTRPEACMDLTEFIIERVTNKKSDLILLQSCYDRVK